MKGMRVAVLKKRLVSNDKSSGFLCPKCLAATAVFDSRANRRYTGHPDGTILKRRRICVFCDFRFSTWEIIGKEPPTDLKAAALDLVTQLRETADKLEAGVKHYPDPE